MRYFKIDLLIIFIQVTLLFLSILFKRNHPVISHDNSMMGIVFFPQILVMAFISILPFILTSKMPKQKGLFIKKFLLSIFYIFMSAIISINIWNTELFYSTPIFFLLSLIIYILSFYFSNKYGSI